LLLLAIAAVTVLLALHLSSVPATLWEYDESLFAHGVERYEPLLHHPPPPGAPIYTAVGKLFAVFTGDPFRALVAVSILGLVAGFVLLALAIRALTDDLLTGIAGSFLYYASPVMLIHGTLPQSDTGGLALLALSIWMCARAIRIPETVPILAMAVACAATVGWRPQFAIAVVPLFLTATLLLRGGRARFVALQAFGVACLLWLVPLVVATGGPEGFWKWLSSQAAYFAAHDADLSRSGQSLPFIALRFIAHPWGPKWLSFALLALALVGAAAVLVPRFRGTKRALILLPVAVMTVVYLAFGIAMMDPADAPRYGLPAEMGVAIAAAIGLVFLREKSGNAPIEWLPLAAWAAGSYIYTAPVLRQRTASPSPPVAAIAHLRKTVPPNGVILVDLALRPHADYMLRNFRTMRIDAGITRYGLDATTPLFIFADGEAPNGTTFRWQSSDAYRKLTRNHFGAASVIVVKPEERFRAESGIHAPERTPDGKAWQWIGERGVLRLPDIGARRVRLTFDLPRDYPFPDNRVHVERDGVRVATAKVPGTVEVDAAPRLTLVPDRSFVPAELPGTLNRDRRRLSVMLTRVEQLR
jgi:hypothetical protein